MNKTKKFSFASIFRNQIFIPIVALLILVLFNLIADPSFFKITYQVNANGNYILNGNLIQILDFGSELAILAIGMTLVTAASGGQDISVGAAIAIAGSVVLKVLCGTNTRPEVGQLRTTFFVAFLVAVLAAAAFGAFTDVTYTTPQEYKNHLGHMAYLLEGLKRVPGLSSYHMKITYDDHTIEDDFLLGMVTNSLRVGGFPNPNSRIAEFDDGLYEALLLKYPKNPVELQATVSSYIMGEYNPDCMYQFKARRIVVESQEAVQWTLDGEFGGSVTSAEIINLPRALNVIRK